MDIYPNPSWNRNSLCPKSPYHLKYHDEKVKKMDE